MSDRQEIEALRERFEGRPHDPEDWHGGIPESIANCPICSAHAALDALAASLAESEAREKTLREALKRASGYADGCALCHSPRHYPYCARTNCLWRDDA